MTDFRTLLAAVLGVGVGLVLLAAPDAVVRVQTLGRVPRRRGEYGADGDAPTWARALVRVVGTGLVLGGAYFGWTLV
ncbi:MAG: hypothetical protein ABEJ70_00450 [Halobacteriaceae archaeon]